LPGKHASALKLRIRRYERLLKNRYSEKHQNGFDYSETAEYSEEIFLVMILDMTMNRMQRGFHNQYNK